MPGYVQKALVQFNHRPPSKPQHQPHPHQPIQYGAKKQTSQPEDSSPLLDKAKKKFVQEVTGVFLFYARAVDSTMLVALSAIAAEQGAPTENTLTKVNQFLDYAVTHPDATVTYKASNIGTRNSLRCILSQRTKSTITSRRTLFHVTRPQQPRK